VVRGYEERDLSRLQLEEVTYVPFILINENGEALWILVEIDKIKKKVRMTRIKIHRSCP
jgi:hypothetical protein